MVGIMVDAFRMRPTKTDWDILLQALSEEAGRRVDELHTRDFYAGNGLWRGLEAPQRTAIIDAVLDWLQDRKHSLVYCAVEKQRWLDACDGDERLQTVATIWRLMGLHLVLAIQKHNQTLPKGKGNTVLVIDNEERERTRFTDLILRPPQWTDTYYARTKKQEALDQIVDAPYFADSRDVPLLQVADFLAYFLRRHIELETGGAERYEGERPRVAGWTAKALARGVPKTVIYPRRARCECAQLFYDLAPAPLRS
jgi:hypothetical protein